MIRRITNRMLSVFFRRLSLCLIVNTLACLLYLPAHEAHGSMHVTAVVLADFPPLYITDANGKPDGFAIDVFRAIALDNNLEYDFLVVKNWAEALDAIRTGRADVIPGIGVSPIRQAEFLFTETFETIPVSCFVREDTFDIKSINDLIGLRTAVINQSAAQSKLTPRIGVRLMLFDNIDEALFSLLAGKVDAFVFPAPVLLKKAREIHVDNKIKIVGKPLMELRRGYLLRKTDVELAGRLSASLRSYVASKPFSENYLKWYGKGEPFWTATLILTTSGVLFFVSMAILVVWRYLSIVSLNRELKDSKAQLKASEQRLNRSQEIASFGSFERDLTTGEGYWSNGLFKILGFPKGKGAPAFEPFLESLHPEDQKKYLRSIELMTMPNPHSTFEFRFKPDSKKEYRYAMCSQTHEFSEDGTPIKRIGAIQDITERKAVDAELIRARDNAEAASRAKSEFLANMSHELRTPLNGAMGMMQLLAMDELAPEHRKYVETAITSCKNLTQLLSDILDLSKVEAGKLELVNVEFRPEEILDSVRETFSLVAEDKGLGFPFTTSDGLPECLEGDSVRLRQVLFNLVGNALKFTEEGSVSVAVSRFDDADPGTCRLLFSVIDTGIGIPDDMIDKIFGAFTQVDGAYTRKFQGTGLGLNIVKRLVELMDGNISVVSEMGKGTTIHVSIRFRILENPSIACQPSFSEVLPLAGPKSILIAEDDRVNRLTVYKFVEKLGHSAVCVTNGEEALSQLAQHHFDLILMDIQMPIMNGIEATRRIRKATVLGDKQNIPIIALTAHAMSSDRDAFLKEGMTDYLAKPISIQELKKILEKNLPR